MSFMLTSDIDIHKLAEKLIRVGREEVAWERRKLQWILEHKKEIAKEGEAS